MGYGVSALVDSGATKSLVNHSFYLKIRSLNPSLLATPIQLQTVSGEILSPEGKLILSIDKLGTHEFIVVRGLTSDIILGSDFLTHFGGEINYETKTVKTRNKHFPMTYTQSEKFPVVHKIFEVIDLPSYLQTLQSHSAFRNELGHCRVGDPLRILTIGPPIKQKSYRQPLVKRHIIEEEVQKMLDMGVIKPSQSPWASPVTLVPKPDGSTRFCIDYRRVNAITENDCYPIPNIQELFDTLQGSSVFTTLDLRSGYWQVDVHPEDQPKTAFVCHVGLYEFNRLPFGLVNAPSQFQRLMNVVLAKHLGKICLVYIDDIVIFSKDEKEHADHVRMVLDTIAEAGLTLKLKKCHFGKKEVKLLGYTVSKHGISPQEDKVRVIRDMQPPTNLKELQRLLGMTGYYRQTIKGYAQIVEPLNRLCRKNELFLWGPDQQEAFEKLKQELTSDRVMAYPHPDLPYKLYTDASGYAVGAILAQDIDGVERPVHYVSKTLNETQRKWSAIEREAYAIIYAIEKLRPYLVGARFTVYTDHKPLRSLFQAEIKNFRIQRWSMYISETGCKIEYRKGSNNTCADMLSRLPGSEVASLQDVIVQSHIGGEQQEEFPEEWTDAESEDSGEFVIDNGELYSLRLPYEGALPMPRLFAPKSMQSQLIEEAHKELGHRGVFTMLRRIQNFAVWPRMKKHIREFIERCPHCQGNRQRPRATAPEVTDTPHKPFERIGVDLTGPLLPSPAGNKYLLVVIDHLTGWAEAYPIPDKRSATVWNKLYAEFFPRFGFPEVLVTDQGQEFNSASFKSGLQTLGIQHKRTTPGHPQTNGMAERFNRTLKNTLRKLCNNQTSQWENHLPDALWAYRISETETRGSSPYYLLFGQIPNKAAETIQTSHRFENLARAHRLAYQKQEEAKTKRHDRSHLRPLERNIIKVGDTITIDCSEPITLSHLRDHAYKVVSIRGKVLGYVPLHVGSLRRSRIRYINIDRVRAVPDTISWDDINPRQRRNRTDTDVRTWTAPHNRLLLAGNTDENDDEHASDNALDIDNDNNDNEGLEPPGDELPREEHLDVPMDVEPPVPVGLRRSARLQQRL